jgi:ferrous iron transport protein B
VSRTSTNTSASVDSGLSQGPGAAGPPTVIVVGNPNVGKTTLFNHLTGQRARVGNYPGVTVERRAGVIDVESSSKVSSTIELVDVPGTYSLAARSAEEQIAINVALGLGGNVRPQLAVVVVDAGQLVRNLYLAVQLIEMEVPCIIALNMIDEVGDRPPDPAAISKLLGVPCVATNARAGKGIDALRTVLADAVLSPPCGGVALPYSAGVVRAEEALIEALPKAWRADATRDHALARWALLSIDEDDELLEIDEGLRRRTHEVRREAANLDFDREVIQTRYAFLDEASAGFYTGRDAALDLRTTSDRVDSFLIHPVFGFATFMGVMTLLFQSLFTWADPAISLVEDLVGGLQGAALSFLPDGILRDLLVEGLLGGVGNVIVFLPQILLLFFFIGLLEDSGYMARVAYLMDRVMNALGLHGRAFVPMLSGFACAIPAILATRTMERKRDRLLTMMVVPLMTCSARLPVYTLIIAALFPPTKVFGFVPIQAVLMVAMYLFATMIALLSAAVLGRTAVPGCSVPLILELPPYRLPKLSTTLRMMFEKAQAFLTDAGTVILVCTVLLWGLLSFPRLPEADSVNLSAQAAQAVQIENSYGGRLGKAIEPALAPLGFDWKLGVGIIGAFAAREVFVSTMGIVYGVGDGDEEIAPLRDRMRAETRADGSPAYSPLVGLSLMVFFALACQCMGTLAVVKRETGGWRWPTFLFVYMTALAWGASFIVYQGGTLLGF